MPCEAWDVLRLERLCLESEAAPVGRSHFARLMVTGTIVVDKDNEWSAPKKSTTFRIVQHPSGVVVLHEVRVC
jgi:hypothetical protein